jgi:parallel beta-helix repeat protein
MWVSASDVDMPSPPPTPGRCAKLQFLLFYYHLLYCTIGDSAARVESMQLRAKAEITLLVLIAVAVSGMSAPSIVSPRVSAGTHGGFTKAYTPHDAILIDGNAELVAKASSESWPGNGSEDSPYLIAGYYFYDFTHSIAVRNVDLFWSVVGNEIDGSGSHDTWCGIQVDNSSNGLISQNIFHRRYRGIDIIDVANMVITGNTIEDNLLHGIGSEGFMNGCVISDNSIRRCEGAGVWSPSAYDSEISRNIITDCDGGGVLILAAAIRCQIADNLVVGSSGIGIQVGASADVEIIHNRVLDSSGRGFYVTSADRLDIYNNTILNCSDYGMDLRSFGNSLVHNNTIADCDGTGIRINSGQYSTFQFNNVTGSTNQGIKTEASASNMTVTRNIFCGNGAASQASDDGGDNIYIFNYFNEWASPDANSDGIVDIAYDLDGAAQNTDPYPLARPDVVPTTPEETTNSGSSTSLIPVELILAAAGIAVVLLVGVFIIKKRA